MRQDLRKSNLLIGLLLVCLLLLVGLEMSARLLLPRMSRIEGRTEREAHAAQQLAPAPRERHLLMVGNSLLEAGVDVHQLTSQLPVGWSASRFVVESTNYIDWYYGLKRLFERGSRPDAVILMLSARQVLSNGIRGPYSAYHLWAPLDAVIAGRRLDMSMTRTSDLWFSSVLASYGVRYEMRNFVLQRAFPAADVVVSMLRGSSAPGALPSVELADRPGALRVDELSALCRRHAVRCMLVLPASMGGLSDGTTRLAQLADARGLHTSQLVVDEGLFAPDDFQSDHFHMSIAGARRYTDLLAARLTPLLVGDQ